MGTEANTTNGGFLRKWCVANNNQQSYYFFFFFITAFQEHGRTKRARLSTINELQANSETHHSDERNLFKSIAERSEMYTSQALAQVSCSCSTTIAYS